MGDVQEKRPEGPGTEVNRISDRLGAALNGGWSYLRVHGSEASMNKRDLEAILDALDEAKHLHEVERDRANDLLSDRDYAIERVAKLEAEVERQKSIVSDACRQYALSRSASQREQARANKAEMRVAELEEAAREAVRCWFTDESQPVGCAMRRLRDLVGDPDFEAREDAPLPDLEEAGDQRPRLDTLDDVALALSSILDRLARLEARNG